MSRHAWICANEALRVYERRAFDPTYRLDLNHFNSVNDGDTFTCVSGYSLDAPNQLPAGGMLASEACGPTMTTIERGVSLAEQQRREAIAKSIIGELLAELAAEHGAPR